MVCPNCGSSLREEAAFCDKCGASLSFDGTEVSPENEAEKIFKDDDRDLQEQPKPRRKKWIPILSAIGAVVVVGIILIAISMHANVTPTTGTVDSQAPQPTEQQKELTEEEKLRNRYIEEMHKSTYDGTYDDDCFYPHNYSNFAECLLRGQHVFTNAAISLSGTVVSIMPTNSSNDFLATVKNGYSNSDSKVQRVAISGSYDNSDNRLVKDDTVSVIGKFSGVEMFTQTDDSHVEYGSLKDCKINNIGKKFTPDDLEKIIKSIFGDVSIERDTEAGFIKFTRTNAELNQIENWLFYQHGSCALSLDGGNWYHQVVFDLNCQHYYVIEFYGEGTGIKSLKYCDISGREIWKKEFKDNGSSYNYKIANDTVYVYTENELKILNGSDGTDKIKPIYMPDRSDMFVVEDIVYMVQSGDSTDAIIALDLSGNILWKFSLDSSFTLSNIGRVENELLIESYFNDRSSNDSKIYYRYKRINAKTGEVVSEFKMPDDYN